MIKLINLNLSIKVHSDLFCYVLFVHCKMPFFKFFAVPKLFPQYATVIEQLQFSMLIRFQIRIFFLYKNISVQKVVNC